jgi:hypothetical protein
MHFDNPNISQHLYNNRDITIIAPIPDPPPGHTPDPHLLDPPGLPPPDHEPDALPAVDNHRHQILLLAHYHPLATFEFDLGAEAGLGAGAVGGGGIAWGWAWAWVVVQDGVQEEGGGRGERGEGGLGGGLGGVAWD